MSGSKRWPQSLLSTVGLPLELDRVGVAVALDGARTSSPPDACRRERGVLAARFIPRLRSRPTGRRRAAHGSRPTAYERRVPDLGGSRAGGTHGSPVPQPAERGGRPWAVRAVVRLRGQGGAGPSDGGTPRCRRPVLSPGRGKSMPTRPARCTRVGSGRPAADRVASSAQLVHTSDAPQDRPRQAGERTRSGFDEQLPCPGHDGRLFGEPAAVTAFRPARPIAPDST